MQRCFDRYIRTSCLLEQGRLRVVDLGSADVNGSYRDVFCDPKFEYVGVDCQAGPGVDLVLSNPYEIPIDDNYADIVLCGQMLEHCPKFWQSFREMLRVLQPEGYLFLIVPSAGPIHRYPVDCYRFYPDALQALADYGECSLVDWWHDERGPWKDLVGVFRCTDSAPRPIEMATNLSSAHERVLSATVPRSDYESTADEEVMVGKASYLDVLRDIHASLLPRRYLEVGVRQGASLALASCDASGIDPCPQVIETLSNRTRVFEMTSDRFFDDDDARRLLGGTIDFAFIDGMHHFEYAFRDFMHIERYATPWTIVAIDDVFPNHPRQAKRERETRVWAGDVWKIPIALKRFRSDLTIAYVDAHPTGLCLVAGLNPDDRRLWEGYNPIVREFGVDLPVPPEVLHRTGALPPTAPRIGDLVRILRASRGENATVRVVHDRLGTWRRSANH